MFSQFRNAVEHLAVQPMRRSTSQDSDTSNVMSRTNSGEDGHPSSTQLADSALSNIRKSLQVQHSSSPARAGTNGTANGGAYDPNKPRSRLEERLRASLSFGIGEVSNPSTEVNTPISTKAPTPLPGTDATPLSPTQAPLPESPISPTTGNGAGSLTSLLLSIGDPLGASSAVSSTIPLSHPHGSPTAKSEPQLELPVVTTHKTDNDPPLSQPTPVHRGSKTVDVSPVKTLERVVEFGEDDEDFQGRRYAEAQMPLPPTPPPESPEFPSVDPPTSNLEHQSAAVDDIDKDDVSPPATTDPPQTNPNTEADPTGVAISSTNNADGNAAGTDVEVLRQQLKRFKERFTGSETTDIGRSMLTG